MQVYAILVVLSIVSSTLGARTPFRKSIKAQFVGRSPVNLPRLPLPLLPPLFSSFNSDGSYMGGGPPQVPPGEDNSLGEDEGDDNEGEGAVTAANPMTALAMWLSGGLSEYNKLLETNPTTTKIVTSGVIGALGDLFSQVLEGKYKNEKSVDFRRLLIFTLSAALYFAPVIGAWFTFLNNVPIPGGDGAKALGMLLIDQTAGALSVIGTYFFFYELIDHLIPGGSACEPGMHPLASIVSRGTHSLKYTLPNVLVANWKVWPVVNFLNFRFVPPMYQLLVSNLASFFWNVYLAGATIKR